MIFLEERGLILGVVAGDTQRGMKEKGEGISRGWDELLGRGRECRGRDGQASAVMEKR